MASKKSVPKKSLAPKAEKEEYVWALEGDIYISNEVYGSVEACLSAANKTISDFHNDDVIVIYKAVAKAAVTNKMELI